MFNVFKKIVHNTMIFYSTKLTFNYKGHRQAVTNI